MKIVPLIFAAGKGTRLRPLTHKVPKPLVPVKGDLSMIDINIERLIKDGFDKCFITVSYKRRLFEKTVKKYKDDMEIVLLEVKFGSSGHIAPVRDNLELLSNHDMLLGLNGDTFVDLELKNLLKAAKKETMLIAGSSELTTLPKQLICQDNKLIGVNTKPPYYYKNTKGNYELRNNIGLYLIPISFIELVKGKRDNIGMFDKKDLADIAINNMKKVECINLAIHNFWSFNTMEDLEYVKSNFS